MSTIFIIFILILSGLLAGLMFNLLRGEEPHASSAAYHPYTPPQSHAVNTTRRYAGRFSTKNTKV